MSKIVLGYVLTLQAKMKVIIIYYVVMCCFKSAVRPI